MDALLRRRIMMMAGGSPTPPGPIITPVIYNRLVFDGTAYIETNIVIPANGSIRVSLGNETQTIAQRLFRAEDANGGAIAAVLNSSTTSSRRYFSTYYDSSSSITSNRYLAFSSTTYAFYMTPKGFGWGSTFYTYTKGSNHPTGGLFFGGYGSGNPYTGTMSIIRIYDSDAQNCQSASALLEYTPVYTLEPCTYDGVAGLWCSQNSTFYGNSAGSGTLSVENDS